MIRRAALLVLATLLISPCAVAETKAPRPEVRARDCARNGYSKIDDQVVEHFRCPDGARVLVPRPELKEIPRPFVPTWRKWPDEINV